MQFAAKYSEIVAYSPELADKEQASGIAQLCATHPVIRSGKTSHQTRNVACLSPLRLDKLHRIAANLSP
jgi:hypothetical protein